jgi:hypothetical protein
MILVFLTCSQNFSSQFFAPPLSGEISKITATATQGAQASARAPCRSEGAGQRFSISTPKIHFAEVPSLKSNHPCICQRPPTLTLAVIRRVLVPSFSGPVLQKPQHKPNGYEAHAHKSTRRICTSALLLLSWVVAMHRQF